MTERSEGSPERPGASPSAGEVASDQAGASHQEGATSGQAPDSGVASQEPAGTGTSRVEELESRLQETRENMRRLQSSLDQKVSETESRYQERLREERQRRREAELSGLDDVERLSHQLQWAKEDNQQLQQRLQEREQMEQTRSVADSWADEALRLGVDPSRIDRSDPQATLDSALQGIRDLAASASQPRELQSGGAQQNQQQSQQSESREETPPSVLTDQSGRTDTGPTTPGEVVQQFNEQRRGGRDDWTWFDIKKAARRGQIDRSVIDNVIRSRAEALAGEGQQ